MDFATFAGLHGLEIDSLHPSTRIQRCGTAENPSKKNGAYLYEGDRGWVQAWDGDCEVHWWDDERKEPTEAERAEWARKKEQRRLQELKLWGDTAVKAQRMLDTCRLDEHDYLHRKGLGDTKGLVLPDDRLFVPMYDFATAKLVGCQTIRWDVEDRKWVKKMEYGTRATGAALRLGSETATEACLCEGYATGLSIDKAMQAMRLKAAVIVCFNDSNLLKIAGMLKEVRRKYVFADNDPPQRDPERAKINPGMAGERAAKATGLKYCMSPIEGEDANDLHARAGLMPLQKLIMEARKL